MRTSVASLLLTLVVVPAAATFACECQAPVNFEQSFVEEFERAAVVFRGVSGARSTLDIDAVYCKNFERLPALEQLKCWDTTEIEFAISQVWKGDVPERMHVRTAPRDAACGTGLVPGQEYIVFAYSIPNDNVLHMYLCSPTSWLGRLGFDDLVAFLKRRPSAVPRKKR